MVNRRALLAAALVCGSISAQTKGRGSADLRIVVVQVPPQLAEFSGDSGAVYQVWIYQASTEAAAFAVAVDYSVPGGEGGSVASFAPRIPASPAVYDSALAAVAVLKLPESASIVSVAISQLKVLAAKEFRQGGSR